MHGYGYAITISHRILMHRGQGWLEKHCLWKQHWQSEKKMANSTCKQAGVTTHLRSSILTLTYRYFVQLKRENNLRVAAELTHKPFTLT